MIKEDMLYIKDRATGKTFRTLLQSIIYASKGESVYYVTHMNHLKKYYYDRARQIIVASLAGSCVSFYNNKKEIKFKNGGSIKFTTLTNDTLRGIRDPKVVEDD